MDRYNPCVGLKPLCEKYVECILRLKGFVIEKSDAQGYDILARSPTGKRYYIEVKCGRGARLSPFQRMTRDRIERLKAMGFNVEYVVCQFDDDGSLIRDQKCLELLKPYVRSKLEMMLST